MFSCAESACDRHPERSRGIPLRKLKGNVPGISRPSLGMTVIVGRVRLPSKTPTTGSGCPTNAGGVRSLSFMKVEVEKQPDSVSMLQIELPPEQVAKEWNAIADNFARHAKIPGYRPGKAPRKVIEAKFKKEIQEELTKKLVSKSYRDAIAEKQLRVVTLTNLEDVKIGDDKTMRFRATVITAPEFDLPDYKNITVQLPPLEVTEEEVNTAMERLRDQSADFVEVEPERPLQMDDFAVIDFEGTIEGRPISEIGQIGRASCRERVS